MREPEDDRDRIDSTWDGEAIAESLGREIARHDDDVPWSHEPFLEWIAAERRSRRDRRPSGSSEEEVMRREGMRLRARVLARQCGIALVEGPPPLVPSRAHGMPAHVLNVAAAIGAVPLVNLAAAAGAGRVLWDEPAEQWIALARSTARVRRRAIALRIAGESMAPLLRPGDTVLVELGTSLVRGRVVVARHSGVEDGYLCKRVARVGRRDVLLTSIDPAYGSVTIPRDDDLVVGTVRMVWRALRPVAATSE